MVFGKTQMAVAEPDDRELLGLRQRQFRCAPASASPTPLPARILDLTYYLVPSYGLNSAFTTRLDNLVAATPAPVVYPPDHAFTGELATIVQRLNDNLALPGVRSDRLGHDVTPAPVTTRPMLLNGPEDDADIRARLAVFPQSPETPAPATTSTAPPPRSSPPPTTSSATPAAATATDSAAPTSAKWAAP